MYLKYHNSGTSSQDASGGVVCDRTGRLCTYSAEILIYRGVKAQAAVSFLVALGCLCT
jgi:hypothetical protein